MKDWFLSELRSITSPSVAARFALDLSNQMVSLVERRLGGDKERGSVEYGAPDFDDRIDMMRRIVARGRSGEARVDVLLPAELILARVETFPAEARSSLRDEAWFRLDSITPYQPANLCYDVALLGAEPVTGFLDVQIAVAPRDVVSEAVSYATSWGFNPQRVTGPALPGFPDGPLLLQVGDARRDTKALRRSAGVLGAAAGVLLAIGATRGVYEREALAVQLEAEQTKAEQSLRAALDMRRSALDFAKRAMSPVDRRRSDRPALEWMNAIAEALPTNSRAERILMSDGVIRVEGVTESPEGVLSAFESAPAFTQVRHAAALQPISQSPRRWRFAIEARVTARKPDA